MTEQKTLFEVEPGEKDKGPVQCLGLTFENEDDLRKNIYYKNSCEQKI